jgi:tetratricopeptide (TPR) repeat protein
VADAERLGRLPLAGARVQALRGLLAYHRGDRARARAQLEAAVAADPLLVEAWMALGRNHSAEGRDGKAAEVYAEALGHDRGYVPYRIARCEALLWRDSEGPPARPPWRWSSIRWRRARACAVRLRSLPERTGAS